MTQAMIDAVVEGFAAAAERAERAGLDGVEVHGAHSYLVHSFLSPLTNMRNDAYGADRIRFAREVLAAIRASTGPGLRRRDPDRRQRRASRAGSSRRRRRGSWPPSRTRGSSTSSTSRWAATTPSGS